MFENPRRGRQARNFTANVPKILDFNIVFRTDIFQKLSLGAPESPTTQPFQLLVLERNDVQSQW